MSSLTQSFLNDNEKCNTFFLKNKHGSSDNNGKEQRVCVHVLTLFHHDAILLLHVDFGGFQTLGHDLKCNAETV